MGPSQGSFKEGGQKRDESIEDFATRRFSALIAQDLFAPLALGIFGGDIKNLSLKHCFPTLYKFEQSRDPFLFSLYKEPSSPSKLITLRGGLETLPKTLAASLQDHIRYGVIDIPLKYDHLFTTIPASGLIPMQSIAIAQFGWEEQVLTNRGFGYLVPLKRTLMF